VIRELVSGATPSTGFRVLLLPTPGRKLIRIPKGAPSKFSAPPPQLTIANSPDILEADTLPDHSVDYSQIITIEPGKMGGKPCILGMRITVYDLLDYLASGMTEAQILHDFPDLTSTDIRASLAFAADRERRLLALPA
jgi:uncharacterized protein (DUF433 family)